ncbi:Uncharacterised protein [Mycobacteroides abscessus subsp. abscessus]|nr:Uncharacterised protein [Mycobacteroides abscessus subsp. abscessus]
MLRMYPSSGLPAPRNSQITSTAVTVRSVARGRRMRSHPARRRARCRTSSLIRSSRKSATSETSTASTARTMRTVLSVVGELS